MYSSELERKVTEDMEAELLSRQQDRVLERLMCLEAMNLLDDIGIDSATDGVAFAHFVDWYMTRYKENGTLHQAKGIRYIDFKKVVPLSHPTLKKFYRVPIKLTKTQYKVYVGENNVRIFTDKTIPPYILSKLTMAKAACENIVKDTDLYEYDLFVTKDKNGMADVGWRASESMFTLVLHEDELHELRGEV